MEAAAIPPMTPPTMAAVFELLLEGLGVEKDVGVGDALKGPRDEPGPCSGASIKKIG